MIDVLEQVRDHYDVVGLTARLKSALSGFGPEDQRLTPRQLAGVDQFHTRGNPATLELPKLAEITATSSVLDIGSGIGGPARVLAETCGCRVTGVDLSEPFVEAARYLNQRTGQEAQVSFEVGSELDLSFGDAEFDTWRCLPVRDVAPPTGRPAPVQSVVQASSISLKVVQYHRLKIRNDGVRCSSHLSGTTFILNYSSLR